MICASVKMIHTENRFYDAMINDYRSVMTIHLDRALYQTRTDVYPSVLNYAATIIYLYFHKRSRSDILEKCTSHISVIIIQNESSFYVLLFIHSLLQS